MSYKERLALLWGQVQHEASGAFGFDVAGVPDFKRAPGSFCTLQLAYVLTGSMQFAGENTGKKHSARQLLMALPTGSSAEELETLREPLL